MTNKYNGMTVNERLWASGLSDEYYDAKNKKDIRKMKDILDKLEIGEENVKNIIDLFLNKGEEFKKININEEIIRLPELFYKEKLKGKNYPILEELIAKKRMLYNYIVIRQYGINYDSILLELKNHPDVVHYWRLYSVDQRGFPICFFEEDNEQEHGFIVEYYDNSIRVRRHFDDELEACAVFIIQKINPIITMMRDEEKRKRE
jgi:hypothetical protein